MNLKEMYGKEYVVNTAKALTLASVLLLGGCSYANQSVKDNNIKTRELEQKTQNNDYMEQMKEAIRPSSNKSYFKLVFTKNNKNCDGNKFVDYLSENTTIIQDDGKYDEKYCKTEKDNILGALFNNINKKEFDKNYKEYNNLVQCIFTSQNQYRTMNIKFSGKFREIMKKKSSRSRDEKKYLGAYEKTMNNISNKFNKCLNRGKEKGYSKNIDKNINDYIKRNKFSPIGKMYKHRKNN